MTLAEFCQSEQERKGYVVVRTSKECGEGEVLIPGLHGASDETRELGQLRVIGETDRDEWVDQMKRNPGFPWSHIPHLRYYRVIAE